LAHVKFLNDVRLFNSEIIILFQIIVIIDDHFKLLRIQGVSFFSSFSACNYSNRLKTYECHYKNVMIPKSHSFLRSGTVDGRKIRRLQTAPVKFLTLPEREGDTSEDAQLGTSKILRVFRVSRRIDLIAAGFPTQALRGKAADVMVSMDFNFEEEEDVVDGS